jgi:hypothetical protein
MMRRKELDRPPMNFSPSSIAVAPSAIWTSGLMRKRTWLHGATQVGNSVGGAGSAPSPRCT